MSHRKWDGAIAMRNLALWYRRFGEPESVLQAETTPLSPRQPGEIRVRMLFSPVNASDLIPITGAYRHRTPLPAIAGYEGVGIVTETPAAYPALLGKRVLPLRGQGTWQRYVDCPAAYAVPVPDDVDSLLAARAYINPLAAQMMLDRYPPVGKTVLLTAAGSDGAVLLGQWARQAGAEAVYGIHRSPVHAQRLAEKGIVPIAQHDMAAVNAAASLPQSASRIAPSSEGANNGEDSTSKLTGKAFHEASKRVNAIERKLAKLEEQKADLEAQMAAHDPSDYEGLNKLNEQLTAVNTESDDLEAEWLELSEQLE